MCVNNKTENAIVNAVGKMAFTGNVIPEVWYKTIVSPKGKVNLLAVNILAGLFSLIPVLFNNSFALNIFNAAGTPFPDTSAITIPK